MDWASLALGMAIGSLLIELTPGPNMTWLAVLAATEGRRPGLAAVAGVGTGLALLGMIAALGLAALIQTEPMAYQALRWAGLAYLLWLAWQAWAGAGAAEGKGGLRSSAAYFRQGVITNLLNPKAAMFYLTALPSFLPPAPSLAATIGFSAIYVVVATLVHGAIVLAAGTAQSALSSPTRIAAARRVMAGALVGVAVWLFLRT